MEGLVTTSFEYLDVPTGDKAVYGLAESYFVERLTAHSRPRGYDCYREYEYGGGSTFMPTSPIVTHANPGKARVLGMLQGGDDAFGFRFLRPKVIQGKSKERGFQKPDFLAFRANDGVVGEIGTARRRPIKMNQLDGRLRDLKRLVDEEVLAQTHASVGVPVPWHGMRWRAADFHPEEGPVVIPVDENRVISTQPTFEPETDGLYLYQLLRYQGHRLPKGVPVVLPRFTPAAQEQLKELWRRYQQAGRGTPTLHDADGWPSLRRELGPAVNVVGIVAVVVAAAAVVVAAFGVAPAMAGVALAGFVAVLVGGLSGMARVSPGLT
jgi:hypothetical protein